MVWTIRSNCSARVRPSADVIVPLKKVWSAGKWYSHLARGTAKDVEDGSFHISERRCFLGKVLSESESSSHRPRLTR